MHWRALPSRSGHALALVAGDRVSRTGSAEACARIGFVIRLSRPRPRAATSGDASPNRERDCAWSIHGPARVRASYRCPKITSV